jgi:glutamine cyclotransferase
VPASGAPTAAVQVARVLPHDPGAFTQGLFFHDGQLYESTGVAGQSDVRRVDLATGAVQQRVALAAPYFGEGSVIVGNRLYQLTWKHNRAFVYDARTFALVDTLGYTGEGWGLTYDGESIVMSDGTARLRFLDPKTFAVRRTLDVRRGCRRCRSSTSWNG